MNQKPQRATAKLRYTESDSRTETTTPTGSAVTELLAAGLRHHQAGRLAEAETCYRQVLTANPDQAEVHSNLGAVLKAQGKFDEAVAAYRQAIGIKPDYVRAHFNLGNVLKDQGKLDEAVTAYRKAIDVKPDYVRAHFNLGNALKDQGKLIEAVASYRRAIAMEPDYGEVHSSLGNALKDQGKLEEAVASYQRALTLSPSSAGVHNNLGIVLCSLGKLEEAVEIYQRAIALKSDYAEAHSNLGVALKEQGKLEEAVACCQRALTLKPDFAEAHSNLGNALRELGKLVDAVASFQRALAIKPDYADAHSNLGNALHDQGKLEEAVASYQRALAINPECAEVLSNLGNALCDQGKLSQAVASYSRALAVKPDFAQACSDLALCLNYCDKITAGELFAAHRNWHERFGRPLSVSTKHANVRASGRRLKVGYVSPNFRQHSVAYFIEPVLREHDRRTVEVYCYAEVASPDAVTARLKAYADHWVVTIRQSDEHLAERIRADGIDILVDLAGHTGENRLGVFARKPAPVQVTWLGYPNTTGLDAIDYRLVDSVTDPIGEADVLASETLVRLPGGFLCYAGPATALQPALPPSLATGTLTFGSFNNPAKLSDKTLDAWATLLKRMPQSRLMLKGISFADASTRALFLSRLDEREIAAERVELVAWQPSEAMHLAQYGHVDIALDPFPYNGTTTTCEALWMGVPVVTLRGDRHGGRVGASLLSQIDLTDLIANSVEEYVEIALTLANNPGRLEELRRSLRPRMAASPLCDGPAFARKMEAALRAMWQHWCEVSA